MPVNYGYTENGFTYLFDDIFVPADAFRQGNLFNWGTNFASSGTLGINSSATTSRSTPISTFAGGTNWKQVDKGKGQISAAIKSDGTLWTWGQNSYGGLGEATTTSRLTPVTTFAGGTNWKQVAAGYFHCAAIKSDGTLWTWGYNYNGALGINNASNRPTPVTTFAGGTNWKQVGCGFNYTAAIKTDGTLWIWGDNYGTKLGINTTSNRSTPVTTFAGGTNWKQVGCGRHFVAAIKTNGTLWTWGPNYGNMLGTNDGTSRPTPVTTFAGGTNWKQVSSGTSHTAAIKTDGTLWTWGAGQQGRLGNNDAASNRLTPVTTFAGGTNWKQVDCGQGNQGFTSAIKTDGTLWTWGSNSLGQLGDNTSTQRNTPITTFAGGTNWKQVSSSREQMGATTYIDDYL